MADPTDVLKGMALTSVEFVHDYVQLRFDGPCLTINAPHTVVVQGHHYKRGLSGYRDALCERIEHVVQETTVIPADELAIGFDDGSRLIISLKPADQALPEAAVLTQESGQIVVW